MVHSGFLTAYDSVKVKVLRLVDQLTADASAQQPWDVFITGHSLGGALATLCAYDLAGRRCVRWFRVGLTSVVFITGHSLGGALATLCAYVLAGRRCVKWLNILQGLLFSSRGTA